MSSSDIPAPVQDAFASMETALEIIRHYVTDTAEASTAAFDVCPTAEGLLFSRSHAGAFRETAISFKSILQSTLRKCAEVNRIVNGETVRIAQAARANATANDGAPLSSETQSADAPPVAGLGASASSSSSAPTAGEKARRADALHTAQLQIAGDIRQETVRAASEVLESSDARMVSHLMRQLAQHETQTETFAEMALVAKKMEDLRTGQDLAHVYQKRALELQQQIGGRGAPAAAALPSVDFLDFEWQHGGGGSGARPDSFSIGGTPTNLAATGTVAAAGAPSRDRDHDVANQLGRLTSRMKEKWEMAVADRDLAEANAVALEAENALLARRVRDLEERLSLSSASAADRKTQLEREKARSARLLQQQQQQVIAGASGGRRPPSAVSSIMSVDDNESSASGGGGSRHATPNAAARASSGGAVRQRTPSPSQRRSGICIDGVEVGFEFAVWMAKVHRLLLADPSATQALLNLEAKDAAASSTGQQRPPRSGVAGTDDATGGNSKPTPFTKYMAERGAAVARR